MTDLHDPLETHADNAGVTNADDHGRRAALRRLALGGVGAAVGVVALGKTAEAGNEVGPGGSAVDLGETNTSVTPTIIDNTPAAPVTGGPSAFSAGGYVPPVDFPFPAGVGGYGDDTIPNGVHGSTLDPDGYGVVSANLADALADGATDFAPAGLAVASVGGPQIQFVTFDDGVVGPTNGAHVPGEMYADADGTLWFTVPVPAVAPATEAGVRFVKLAGTPTAGAFHILPTAQRVYDSRELPTPTKVTVGDSIDIDLTKTITAADSGFPAGATAAQVNITLDDTELSGFGRVVAQGVVFADENSSNINWYETGQIVANQATTAVSADGGISVQFSGADGSAHLIVDIQGYYL